MAITTIKIFPSIGIARLGNSPTEFFIGPEIPGVRTPPDGGYKDARCQIKRQAARFRLHGYDEAGNLVQEITRADAEITWEVHLANKKASWKPFIGLEESASKRNGGITDRATLEIDPGPRSLTEPNQAAGFNTGKFLGKVVPLGEMRTDADGRLLVLGGFGNSESVPPGFPITNYANNDGWHDDTSDGPVRASVKLNGSSTTITAAPSWVICPPPDFAPPLDSVTTLYDMLFQVAVDKGLLSLPSKPSFTNDIFPILQRVFNLRRVSGLAASGHFSFLSAVPPAGAGTRLAIFNRLRNPNDPMAPGVADMPRLWDDNYKNFQTVTKAQYNAMQKWTGAEGTDWINDWTGSPPPPATAITPEGLTRAALEACVGGAFYPGIESSWFLRDKYNYTEPFRLDHTGRAAGDITKQMAVPWQADFWDCRSYGGYAWWPAQRPDDVFPEAGGGSEEWTRELVSSYNDMVEQWHKLGFIVKKGEEFVETERRKVCTNIFLIADRSHFSEDEVAGVLSAGAPANFDDSFYVVAEGFLPADLGVTKSNPTPEELAPIAPIITFRRAANTTVPGMTASARKLLLEDDALPATLRQRFTFVYRIEFANTDAFSDEVQPLTVTAAKTAGGTTYTSSGILTLFRQPNPYMLDGQTSWLSTDVRVFQIKEGEPRFGFTLGPLGADTDEAAATAAGAFIKNVVNHFNTLASAGHPFDAISTDQAASRLELSRRGSDGKRVFNFAVARVRYRGQVLDADNVRVFFRLFTTAATGLDYDSNSTYRRSISATAPTALLGLQGGELVTVPFYGDPRMDTGVASLDTQTDALNVRTLVHAGADEVRGYFGCWLDFNQTTPRFPNHPTPVDGPWTSGRKSIQELVRGMHQCLVAEVFFNKDLIPAGASPAANDNLAQRNLIISESDNPGTLATHTVQHTFEIKATRPRPQVLAASGTVGDTRIIEAGPDELMVRWNNLPRSTRVTIYLPDVDVDEILRFVGQNYEATRLERVDAHTVCCLPGDVTYIPLPSGRAKNIAALMTLELPEGIVRGQVFNPVVHQVSGQPRAILGAFQFTIPVGDKADLLELETRKLSVLRHIARAIPIEEPWNAVFVRYLDQIADRVRAFGGDPDAVAPSPDGTGRDGAAGGITIPFCSPQYYLLNLNRLPRGTVLIGGVNFNVPVSAANTTAIKLALQGGAAPLQRLNEEFVAAQLSFNSAGGGGSPVAFSALRSRLSNYGLSFAPVTLSNNFLFTPNSTLNDLFEQARFAIRDQRTSDMLALADLFDLLNGNDPHCPGLGKR
jgi:hypothetical protein